MNRQDLEHILAEGRTVEARVPGGHWFRPTNPLQMLASGYELRVAHPGFVNELRDHMETMTPAERLDMVNTLMAGYCQNCGCVDKSGSCQCWNDE